MIKFERLTGAIGAEVSGIDLNAPLGAATCETIYHGLLEHLVLVFRNTGIEPGAQVRLAESLGPVMPFHPFYPSVEGQPPVAVIEDNAQSEPENACWHSDMSAMKVPPFGSVLSAQVIPPYGGDTLWCSMYAVYEALPEETRSLLENRFGVHDMHYGYEDVLDNGKSDTRAADLEDWGSEQGHQSQHALIMHHPATGRPLISRTGRTPPISKAFMLRRAAWRWSRFTP